MFFVGTLNSYDITKLKVTLVKLLEKVYNNNSDKRFCYYHFLD